MDIASNVISVATIKNISYITVFFATAEYLGFENEITLALMILMCIDVMLGITRAAIVDGTHTVRSAIWTRGVLAKILLITALFSCALAAKSLGFQASPLINGTLNVLMLSELYSILGNIHSIKTGKPKAEFDAIAWMLNQIKNLLEKSIK